MVLAHHTGSWLTIDGEPGPLMIRSPDHSQGTTHVSRLAVAFAYESGLVTPGR